MSPIPRSIVDRLNKLESRLDQLTDTKTAHLRYNDRFDMLHDPSACIPFEVFNLCEACGKQIEYGHPFHLQHDNCANPTLAD